MLFYVPSNKSIELGPVVRDKEQAEMEHDLKEIKIPLSRYVVAVPSRSWLVIWANLSITIEIDSQESSTQLVIDTMYFSAKFIASGMTTQAFEGRYGRIEVKVTWFDDMWSKYQEVWFRFCFRLTYVVFAYSCLCM